MLSLYSIRLNESGGGGGGGGDRTIVCLCFRFGSVILSMYSFNFFTRDLSCTLSHGPRTI